MKKLIILFVLSILGFTVAQAQESNTPKTVVKKSERKATITFAESTHDFGDIEQGDVVTHVFEFSNTGDYPLILSNVKTTCGCTVPEWPREPIAPGEKNKITVKFNSRGKLSRQHKVVTIVSNASNSQATVTLVGNIKPAAQKSTNNN